MLDTLFSPTSEQVLKVADLTSQIKAKLEGHFTQIWVQGEISNLRQQGSGHVYFSLKDAESQLPCVLFSRDAAQQGFQLADGMEILVFGSLSVYAPHGRYQLIAKVALQSNQQGRLQIEYERLKRKLADEGLFDRERKQNLPAMPMHIAVVTSPSGAAIRDFIRILQRRNYKGSVTILPARVQGKEAAKEVSQMLKYAETKGGFDLVVITRGGGSIEDLWAFNEETLARNVAACPIPVISAVGHEIDTVLTDYVADQRAETPSAAAELISSIALEAEQRMDAAQSRLLTRIQTELSNFNLRLDKFQTRLEIIAPQRKIEMLGMRLDDLENRLSRSLQVRLNRDGARLSHAAQRFAGRHPRNRIGLARQQLDNLAHSLERAAQVVIGIKGEHLLHLKKRLDNSSLNATLKRGFAVLKDEQGAIIGTVNEGMHHDQISAQLQDGALTLKVLDSQSTLKK